jgi:hypothetical protein
MNAQALLIPIIAANEYQEKVLRIQPTTLRAYWPGNETGGSTIHNAEGTTVRDGSNTGVELALASGPGASMGNAGYWDGTSDFFNIYSASLNGVYDGLELTIAGWARIGAWDGTTRRLFRLAVNTSNEVNLSKSSTIGRLDWNYIAGGTTSNRNKTGLSTTDWVHLALTVSKANDRARAYFNGAQEGADLTGLGAYTGALSSTLCVIGAGNTTPVNVFLGNLAHWAVWNSELTAAEVSQLAVAQ